MITASHTGLHKYIHLYIWYMRPCTLVAQAWCYVMVELSVSHFKNIVTSGNGHFKMEPCALVQI